MVELCNAIRKGCSAGRASGEINVAHDGISTDEWPDLRDLGEIYRSGDLTIWSGAQLNDNLINTCYAHEHTICVSLNEQTKFGVDFFALASPMSLQNCFRNNRCSTSD